MIVFRRADARTTPAVPFPDTTAFDALLGTHAAYTYVVDVRIVDADAIQKINAQYRTVDAPTDVLSFPLYESLAQLPNHDAPLGDLVVCPAMLDTEHLAPAEVIIHGALHLLGFDHETDQPAWDAAYAQVTPSA